MEKITGGRLLTVSQADKHKKQEKQKTQFSGESFVFKMIKKKNNPLQNYSGEIGICSL